MLTSLTYLSTEAVPFDAEGLRVLLDTSRRNNLAAGLTGMMLYADRNFIQTLEGPPDAVRATFARITEDLRHRDIYIALREDIEERFFPDFSMGFEQRSALQAAEIEGFTDYLQARSTLDQTTRTLGRAGVFHRVFRDMR